MCAADGSRQSPALSGWDAVIEVYKRDIDRTLLRENLKLTPEQRVRRLLAHLELIEETRRAGLKIREH